MDNLSIIFADLDPVLALLAGVIIGICATLAVLKWSPAPRAKTDPLSGLFAGDTLDDQLARIADPKARDERKDRAASAIRARIFAHQSAQKTTKRAERQNPPHVAPHRAERFEHAAVLDHIAKVMRAGKEADEQVTEAVEPSGEWEEVLLLPAPSTDSDGVAKAA